MILDRLPCTHVARPMFGHRQTITISRANSRPRPRLDPPAHPLTQRNPL